MPLFDFDAALFAPVYAILGTDAEFVGLGSGSVTLHVIDRTQGVPVAVGGGLELEVLKPACVVRTADLAALGFVAEDLEGTTLTLNGKPWRVHSVQKRPTPGGQGDGEAYCFLVSNEADV